MSKHVVLRELFKSFCRKRRNKEYDNRVAALELQCMLYYVMCHIYIQHNRGASRSGIEVHDYKGN